MLFFEKSQPAPKCLEKEKRKRDGDYKCGDVLQRLKNDFKNKCYICEQKEPLSINVEHFVPHKENKELKFSWDNLFWSCAHCNNIKRDKYINFLNCTNADDRVEERLRYTVDSFPFGKIVIEALDDEEKTQITKKLLLNVYYGSTIQKKIESSNLRKNLIKELKSFQDILFEYLHNYVDLDDEDREFFLSKIKRHLNIASAFVSFKRWMIRDNKKLLNLFEKYLI